MTRTDEIVDYDSNGYDYRTFWRSRDYEQRAEADVVARCLGRIGPCGWLVDLGGGYGRNWPQYRPWAAHGVLVDYSRTNLRTAVELYADDIAAGRLHLLRADLNRLPLQNGAMDVGTAIRVLHHLPHLDATLPEMLRVVSDQALLDVPIKHHALARLEALAHRGVPGVRATATAAPRVHGESDYPFFAFHLDAVRRTVDRLGWQSDIAASVNNFRRWDQVLPPSVVRVLGPAIRSLDAVAQRVGRDWWGPNQFLLLRRRTPLAFAPEAGLAERLRCPDCADSVRLDSDMGTCLGCARTYPRVDGYWDFVGG